MKRCLLIVWLLLSASLCRASLHECYDATCRLHVSGHSGTGCVYAADDTHYYVLTNAHVTQTGQAPQLVFTIRGYETTLPGETVWHSHAPIDQGYHRDVAVVKVARQSFGDYAPQIIPIASESFPLAAGQEIGSSGCPAGGVNTSWKGHIIRVSADAFQFWPPPKGGRSGSAIFDSAGTQIIGLLAWGGGGEGTAQTIGELHRAFRGEPAQKYPVAQLVPDPQIVYPQPLDELVPIQCPDGNCPGGNCPNPGRPTRPRPPGGGDFNPYPGPPVGPPANPAPANPAPVNPAPVNPAPTPAPTQPPASPPVKGCECDSAAKCACDLAGLKQEFGDRLTSIDQKISLLANCPKPTPAPPGGDMTNPPKLSHYALVVDFDAEHWPRTESELVLARKVFPKIHVVERRQVPFVVDALPQLVAYDTAGASLSITKGQHAVELALRKIARREL